MAETDRQLPLRNRRASMFDDGKIERGDETRAIRSSLAVNEDRLSGGPQKREQFLGALRTQLLARGETKVEVIDLKSSRFRDLGFVPGDTLVVAAKVDDCLDAILCGSSPITTGLKFPVSRSESK